MIYRPRPRLVHSLVFSAVLVAGLTLASPSGSLASGGMPVPAVCDQEDSGERIKCKTKNVIDQQEAAAGMMGDIPGMSSAQMERLKKSVGRARNSETRTTGKGFRDLTKRRSDSCRILPVDPNDADGICKGNEDCKEVIGDGIGDDDGICKTTGKPSDREVCEEACDDEAMTDPRNFDDDPADMDSLGSDVEQGLDDATSEYMEFNEKLEGEMLRLAAVRSWASQQAISLDGDDPCAMALLERPSVDLHFGAITAASTLEAMAAQLNPVCNLDVAGFNAAPVCVVFETVAGIARLVTNAVVFMDADADSNHIDNTFECVKTLDAANDAIQGDLTQLKTDMVTVKSELSAVQGKLNAVQEQLVTTIELLKMPQGKRDGFPAK